MVAEGRYCIDVLTQIGAVRSALDGVGLGLLDSHVRHCVAKGDPALLEARADELVGALAGDGRPRRSVGKAGSAAQLRRLEAQIGRIIGMVESDTYCIEVIGELNSAKKTLDGIALELVAGHVRSCLSEADPADREARAGELMAAVGRLVKTS